MSPPHARDPVPVRSPRARSGLCRSFFAAAFESSERASDGHPLDLVAASRHDLFVRADYERLHDLGIRTVRRGLRWPLVERAAGHFDFAPVGPFVQAARQTGIEVIWELCHAWPDGLSPSNASFPGRLADVARAFARWLDGEGLPVTLFTPVAEVSSLVHTVGGSDEPVAAGRRAVVRQHLVAAVIRAADAVWSASPTARLVHVEPMVNVVAAPRRPQDRAAAENDRQRQYEVTDMLAGRLHPELGGGPRHLDVVGLTYHHSNRSYFGSGRPVRPAHREHRSLRAMLAEWYERYGRPLLLAGTGVGGAARARWLRFVCHEVDAAAALGVPVEGICLQPILSRPEPASGWQRHAGLWDQADASGRRRCYEPLARELRHQIESHPLALPANHEPPEITAQSPRL